MKVVLPLALSLLVCPPARAQDKPREEPAVKLSSAEQKILDLTNAARAKEKLPPLKANATLMAVARAHSANQARQGKMAHELDNKGPAQRVKEAGYDYLTTGENVAYGQGLPLEKVFQGWLESKPHRENILNGKYEEIGVGVGRRDNGEMYLTQVFGTPRKKR